MSQEKTFTVAEINEAIKYLESQGFERPQGRANVGQMLLTCSSSTEDVSMVVLITQITVLSTIYLLLEETRTVLLRLVKLIP